MSPLKKSDRFKFLSVSCFFLQFLLPNKIYFLLHYSNDQQPWQCGNAIFNIIFLMISSETAYFILLLFYFFSAKCLHNKKKPISIVKRKTKKTNSLIY